MKDLMLRLRTSCRFIVIAFSIGVLLSACATAPPVQEMSDARQAIAAAREAGAGEFAPNELLKAEALLDGAEDYLEVGTSSAYWQARKAAMQLDASAMTARSFVVR